MRTEPNKVRQICNNYLPFEFIRMVCMNVSSACFGNSANSVDGYKLRRVKEEAGGNPKDVRKSPCLSKDKSDIVYNS